MRFHKVKVSVLYHGLFSGFFLILFLVVVQQVEDKDDPQDAESGLERDSDLLRHHRGRHDQENSQVHPFE